MKRMAKKETVPFRGTKEQEAALMAAIEELKDDPGSLMPIMQKAQEIYGYLPIEVQTMISDATGTPLEKIYGVATFYSQFTLEPKGQYQISVCLGTACYVKGAQQICDQFCELLGIQPGQTTSDGLFTVDALRCIGACAAAPAVSINGKVYARVSAKDIAGILAEYRNMGGND